MAEEAKSGKGEEIYADKEVNTNENVPVETPRNPGPIGIEISAVANLIASGYCGHVERVFNDIMGKDVVVSFDIPK